MGQKSVRLRANLLAHKIFSEKIDWQFHVDNKMLEACCRRLVRRTDRPFTDREQEILQNVLRYIAQDCCSEAIAALQPLRESTQKTDLLKSLQDYETKKSGVSYNTFPLELQAELRESEIAGFLCNLLRQFERFVHNSEHLMQNVSIA